MPHRAATASDPNRHAAAWITLFLGPAVVILLLGALAGPGPRTDAVASIPGHAVPVFERVDWIFDSEL